MIGCKGSGISRQLVTRTSTSDLIDDFLGSDTCVYYRTGADEPRPTGWHSAAASATQDHIKKGTISRAKRSAAMPGWAGIAFHYTA
jgi:hypothetical protein